MNSAGQQGGAARSAVPPTVSKNVVEAFLRDAARTLKAFDEMVGKNGAYDDEELKTFTTDIHGLKAPLAIIGQLALSDDALTLEMRARENNGEAIRELLPPFVSALKKLAQELSAWGNAADSADDNNAAGQAGSRQIREKIQIIIDACEEFDADAAGAAVKELEGLPMPKNAREKLGEISTNLLHSDFEAAAQTAASLLEG